MKSIIANQEGGLRGDVHLSAKCENSLFHPRSQSIRNAQIVILDHCSI